MPNQPWDRQRHDKHGLEPPTWFGRFTRCYRLQGTERNLLAAYNFWRSEKGRKAASGAPLSWAHNAKRWNWPPRAEAWDEYERLRIEAKFQEESDAWRSNRFAGAQQLWDIGKKMLEVFPVARETLQKDGKTTIIEPVTGVLAEVARVWKMADELARTTTRETLPKTEVAAEASLAVTIQKVAGFDNV